MFCVKTQLLHRIYDLIKKFAFGRIVRREGIKIIFVNGEKMEQLCGGIQKIRKKQKRKRNKNDNNIKVLKCG